jgi:hypothetical protein
MATTTNYGWTTPDDTALVKDGAAAIRTLGTSVDTTTKNLNPSTTLGDIEYRSSTANTNTRLAIGTNGQVLKSTGTAPAWGVDPVSDLITTAGDVVYGTAADTMTRLGIGTAGQVLTVNSGATAPEWKTAGATIQQAVFNDTKANATNGGTFTNGAWRTRDINTSQSNSITSCSLASNQITLPAGTFRIEGFAIAFKVDQHQTRIYNITGSAVLFQGLSCYSDQFQDIATTSNFSGTVTFAASTVIELQHRSVTSYSTSGFGKGAGWGDSNIFSNITITKVA